MAELTAFIGTTTMGAFNPSKGTPSPKVKHWRYEINALMKDFGISKPERDKIIRETKVTAHPEDDNNVLYNRAWRKFWVLLG